MSKTIRLSPEAWDAVRQLRHGADSDALTIELVVLAALRERTGERPAELPGQLSIVDDTVPALPGGRVVSANHPTVAASPQARALDGCPHDKSTLSPISSLRKCDACGAVQGKDKVWR